MGLLSGLLGNASEISGEKLEKLFNQILADGEHVEKAPALSESQCETMPYASVFFSE